MAKEVMGTVKWFDEKKGYGFLRTDGIDTDIFCHYKHILGDGFKTLSRNELVTFEAVDTSKGIMAVNIKKIVHEQG